MIRILFTGGGSGGHLYPLVAVNEALAAAAIKHDLRIRPYFLGASGKFTPVLENAGMSVSTLPGAKMRAYFSPLNFLDPIKMFFAFFVALFRLLLVMPDVVFSKGGPGALPVVLAARVYRIPVLVHDSDAVPGRTNVISAKFAGRVAVSFSSALDKFPESRTALTGNPIRKEITEVSASSDEAKAALGFSKELPLLLVLGGSQGATRINDFIFDNVSELIPRFQILHQVGIDNFDDAEEQREFLLGKTEPELAKRYKAVPFLDEEYASALRAADLILSRASAGSIFEIAAAGKPSLLVPLPESARNHQRENAYEYAGTGAATVIEQDNLLPTIFFQESEKILGDKAVAQKMSEAAKAFAKPESAAEIAEELVKIALKI